MNEQKIVVFKPVWQQYLQKYPQLLSQGITTSARALKSYYLKGQKQKHIWDTLEPRETWIRYVEKYADLFEAGIVTEQQALDHYTRHGKNENRQWWSDRDTLEFLHRELYPTPEGHWGIDHWTVVKEIIEKTGNLNYILEIGLNAGHSTCLWLFQCKAKVVSVDICFWPHVKPTSDLLTQWFGSERFEFISSDSRTVLPLLPKYSFDLVFIDGGHSIEVCLNDLKLAEILKIKWILIDDTNDQGVRHAVLSFVSTRPLWIKTNEWNNIGGGMILYCVNSD